jgi:hypothetical protein
MRRLSYDPETGIFSRNSGRRAGLPVGSLGWNATSTYIVVSYRGRLLRAHRLAFLYMTGQIPKIVDHIDGNGENNRWANLRPSSAVENSRNQRLRVNNKTGVSGVIYLKKNNAWEARIGGVVGKRIGQSHNFFDACCMRKSAEVRLGYSERHGR